MLIPCQGAPALLLCDSRLQGGWHHLHHAAIAVILISTHNALIQLSFTLPATAQQGICRQDKMHVAEMAKPDYPSQCWFLPQVVWGGFSDMQPKTEFCSEVADALA